jgi:hypothetical protein
LDEKHALNIYLIKSKNPIDYRVFNEENNFVQDSIGDSRFRRIIGLDLAFAYSKRPKSAWIFEFPIERIAMLLAFIEGLVVLIVFFLKLLLDEKSGAKLAEKVQSLVSRPFFSI